MLKYVSFLNMLKYVSFLLQDYWSVVRSYPSKDASQDYKLIRAMEEGGKTYVDFYRNATTGDAIDVQFMVKFRLFYQLHLKENSGDSVSEP